MDGGLPAGEHHHLRLALRGDEHVEHPVALLEGDRVAVGLVAGVGEADRAVQVAVGVDLDDPEAGVLLVLRAQPAVRRAAVLDLGLEGQRDRAGLVEPRRGQVRLRVAVDQRLELAVLPAALAQVDLVLADVDLGVDHHLAHRADALGVLDEHLVPVPFPLRHRPLPTSRFFSEHVAASQSSSRCEDPQGECHHPDTLRGRGHVVRARTPREPSFARAGIPRVTADPHDGGRSFRRVGSPAVSAARTAMIAASTRNARA